MNPDWLSTQKAQSKPARVVHFVSQGKGKTQNKNVAQQPGVTRGPSVLGLPSGGFHG